MKKSTKAATRRRRTDDDPGTICDSPLCFQFEVKFQPKTITLESVDLFDPKVPGGFHRIDLSDLDAQGTTVATDALKDIATDGVFETSCRDDGCVCRTDGAKWSKWTGATAMAIYGKFSTDNPNPKGPAKLRYRANGTVQAKSRMKIGTCYHTTG